MKIALVSPRRPLWSKNPKIRACLEQRREFLRPWYSPPLGLLTLASLSPDGVQLTLHDEDFEPLDLNIDCDLVAISAMTQQAYRAYEIADSFRKRGTPVIMGGIHATVMPSEALEHVDAVVKGEAEALWETVVEDYSRGCMRQTYENQPGFRADLAAAPTPRFDLVSPDMLRKDSTFFNMLLIQATRGCPHDCEFCLVSEIHGRRIRTKSVSQVVQEIEEARERFGNPLIAFADDNLFVNRRFAKDLLTALVPLGIRWAGQSDVAIAENDRLLELARASGCIFLLIGLESLDEVNLRSIDAAHWKMKHGAGYDKSVRRIQEQGIAVHASFVVGFDNDDASVFGQIRDFMIRNHCGGQFTVLTPLPGSRLYARLKHEGRLLEDNYWDKCNFFDVVFEPKRMTVEELVDGFIWLHNEVFNWDAVGERFMYMKRIQRRLGGAV